MKTLVEKHLCCGCSACMQVCGRHCITMQPDKEGFLYPSINLDTCVDCGLCEKVCPILRHEERRTPLSVLAGKNVDKKIQEISSSGGVFYEVAYEVINSGGVVFGACFDENWNVIHSYTETMDGILPFMTSKYVQSYVKNTYNEAKMFLNQGRLVLFTGTPCQIAGLKHFLRKPYSNLITLDFLCHGVPSPKVWSRYLDEIRCQGVSFAAFRRLKAKIPFCSSLKTFSIREINFRDKSDGWQKYRFVLRLSEADADGKKNSVLSSNHKKNPYMRGFLKNLYLRPSCHNCKFKHFQSQSDITIADYWAINRINPSFGDSMGVSMIFVHNDKANKLLSHARLETIETSFADTLSNEGLKENVQQHKKRAYFFEHLDKTHSVKGLINKCVGPSFLQKVTAKLKHLFQ